MFISSYSTYIQNSTSNKTNRVKEPDYSKSDKFDLQRYEQPTQELATIKFLPIDYIQQNRSFSSKLELLNFQAANQKNENELNKPEKKSKAEEFKNFKTLSNAKTAYTDNSKMFSLLRKPQVPLDQTPHIDDRLPQDIQALKEQNMRRTMLNTYVANDIYYKITA
jgi:hypothetical protein